MTTHRTERVASLILDVVARAIRQHLRDPRIGFVTLTGVRMSPDLKHARVYVSLLGGATERRLAVDALNHAAPFLRRALGRQTGLRYTPELVFVEDPTSETGFRVEQILDAIQQDPPAAEGTSAPASDADPRDDS